MTDFGHAKCTACGREFPSMGSLGNHARYSKTCTAEARFWGKVNKDGPNGCWEWIGALQRDGYAHFTLGGKTISSHRHAYEQLVEPVPAGMDLMHLCDNRKCVNPAHLRPGTELDNMVDAVAKRRHAWGARNSKAVMTPEIVLRLRAEYRCERRGKSNIQELVEKYGFKQATISAAVNGRTWRYL